MKSFFRNTSLWLGLACLTSLGLNAGEVREGVLSNGLTYHIESIDENDTLECRLVIQAGVAQEPDHLSGIAAFIAHVQGSFHPHLTQDFQTIISDFLACTYYFGEWDASRPILEAEAGFETSLYHLSWKEGGSEQLPAAVATLSQWARALPHLDFDTAWQSFVSRWDNPSSTGTLNSALEMAQASEEAIVRALGNAAITKHLPHLCPSLERQPNWQEVQDYFRTWYQPQHMKLVIVGDINVAETEELVRSSFSQFCDWGLAPVKNELLLSRSEGMSATFHDYGQVWPSIQGITIQSHLKPAEDESLEDFVPRGLEREFAFSAAEQYITCLLCRDPMFAAHCDADERVEIDGEEFGAYSLTRIYVQLDKYPHETVADIKTVLDTLYLVLQNSQAEMTAQDLKMLSDKFLGRIRSWIEMIDEQDDADVYDWNDSDLASERCEDAMEALLDTGPLNALRSMEPQQILERLSQGVERVSLEGVNRELRDLLSSGWHLEVHLPRDFSTEQADALRAHYGSE